MNPSGTSPHLQAAIAEFWTEYQQTPALMQELQSLITHYPAVQQGSYFWRSVSEDGSEFRFADAALTTVPNVIAWSRILDGKEILSAINFNRQKEEVAYVTIDSTHSSHATMKRLYGPGSVPAELNVEDRNGKAIRLTIPARTLVIYG